MTDSFEELDPEVQEYIDQLHSRIEWLEEELAEAEKTVMELCREQATSSSSYGPEDILRFYRENTVAEVLAIFEQHGKDIEQLEKTVERLNIDADDSGIKLLSGGTGETTADQEELKDKASNLQDKVDEEYTFDF